MSAAWLVKVASVNFSQRISENHEKALSIYQEDFVI
jgi:hypothetical protein